MSDRPAKNLFSHSKLRLAAPNPNQPKGKWCNLLIDIWMNNPRLILQTNDPAMQSRNYGRFTAPIETPTLLALVELIDAAIANKEPHKEFVEVYSKPKGADFSAPAVHICDIVVGRDTEGSVFIALAIKEDGWPNVKFVYAPPDARFVKLRHGSGTPFTKQEISELYAKAYTNLMRIGTINVLNTHHVEAQRPGQQGGGGYQQRPQGGSGYQQRQQQNNSPAPSGGGDVMEDDLPF